MIRSNTTKNPSPSGQASLLQDSSLVTWHGSSPGVQPLFLPSEQKKQSPDQPPVQEPLRSPVSPVSGGARRWEIQYGELKLEHKLGHGAFGEVFSGSYRKSKVAIKQYDFRGKLPSEQEQMLLQEADIMEGLRSEYLVGFRGVCLDPRYCLVMELCEGGTLRARLDKTSEAITPLEQLRWAMQIGYGLYQLHSVKIIHRDLKGENILLDTLNHTKVADFGLSIVKSNSASHSKKGTGRGGAGTIPWMAPELHEDQPNSKETDVYSLGVVLWEIVSRKMPYAGLVIGQMISKTVQGKRDPLPNPCPEVFRLMITACCDLEAKQRPTAEQVGDQFAAAIQSVESIPTSLPIESPKPSSIVDIREEEMKKLLEKVKQLELEKAQEAQQRAEIEKKSAEEKRRLGAENERIKQQYQIELKRSENLKHQTSIQTSQSTPPPLAPLSQNLFTITAPQPIIPGSPRTSSLSGNSSTLTPQPVIPRLDRGSRA